MLDRSKTRLAFTERISCGERDCEEEYAQMIETIGRICPTVRTWVGHTNCFEERLAKRVPKKSPNPASLLDLGCRPSLKKASVLHP